MNGAVDAAAAEEGFVGGVDDAVDLEFGYVIADKRDGVVEGLGRFIEGVGSRNDALESVEERGGGDFGQGDERSHVERRGCR